MDKLEKCRTCNRKLKESDLNHKKFYPFCSERCKMAELGMWLDDRYRINRDVGEVSD